jgi:hypothetical protein
MNKDTSIHVKCTPALKKELEERAKENKMKFSDFIRWILRKATKGSE